MSKYPEGTCLFAGGSEHVDNAKDYIKKNNLTSEDIELVGNDKETLIITKKCVELTA